MSSRLTVLRQLFKSKITLCSRIMIPLCPYFQTIYRVSGAEPPQVTARGAAPLFYATEFIYI